MSWDYSVTDVPTAHIHCMPFSSGMYSELSEIVLWLVPVTTLNDASPLRKRAYSASVLARGMTSSCSATITSVGAATLAAYLHDSNLSRRSPRTGKYRNGRAASSW